MKTLLIVAVLACIAKTLNAQGAERRNYGPELRLGVQVGSLSGSYAGEGSAVGASGTLTAAELYARIEGIGLILRTQSLGLKPESGDQRDISQQEARVLIGTRKASIELGILQRTVPGVEAKKESLGRVGLRLQWEIGGSGLGVSLNGGVQVQSTKGSNGRSVRYRGHDGEALIIYRFPPRYPAFAGVGWRVHTIDDDMNDPAEVFSQSGPVLMVGLRLGS